MLLNYFVVIFQHFLLIFLIMFYTFRVTVKDKDVKVNIFDMAGHPIFYEVSK